MNVWAVDKKKCRSEGQEDRAKMTEMISASGPELRSVAQNG